MKFTVESFWNRVDKSGGKNACWIWTGAKHADGYGEIRPLGKRTLAHRFSYTMAHGEIPIGLFVCHRCDVPPCVNPSHLFLGTNKENLADKVKKRRHLYREKHPMATLSSSDVDSIRKLYKSGVKQKELGKRYGVGQPHVSSIVNGRYWRNK